MAREVKAREDNDRRGSGWMIVTAAVLGALVALQAWRLGASPAMAAGDVIKSAGLTAITADSGNDDVLLVIDDRQEQLLVYRVERQSIVELVRRYELPALFSDARNRVEGRR